MADTTLDFYRQTRALFADLAELADKEYLEYWGNSPEEEEEVAAYSWFESVANALNRKMRHGLFVTETAAFFSYVSVVLSQCSEEVANCIDVAFVENLFWRVPPDKASPYWAVLPPALQTLYLGFHSGRPDFSVG